MSAGNFKKKKKMKKKKKRGDGGQEGRERENKKPVTVTNMSGSRFGLALRC